MQAWASAAGVAVPPPLDFHTWYPTDIVDRVLIVLFLGLFAIF